MSNKNYHIMENSKNTQATKKEVSFSRVKKRALIETTEMALIRWNKNQPEIRRNLMIDFLKW